MLDMLHNYLAFSVIVPKEDPPPLPAKLWRFVLLFHKCPSNVCNYSIIDNVLQIVEFSVIEMFYAVLVFVPSISLEISGISGGIWGHDDLGSFCHKSSNFSGFSIIIGP